MLKSESQYYYQIRAEIYYFGFKKYQDAINDWEKAITLKNELEAELRAKIDNAKVMIEQEKQLQEKQLQENKDKEEKDKK